MGDLQNNKEVSDFYALGMAALENKLHLKALYFLIQSHYKLP